ncbi:MAG: C39 family peptidase [Actinomycetota bacterium]
MIRPALGLLLLALQAMPAAAGDTPLVTAAGTFTVPVISLREARFHTVVRQQYDFSCGSAALATLLTYHYNRPTSEEDAFRAMFAAGDQAAIRKYGFSLYDMQKYLTTLGLSSDGFKVTLDRLVEVGVPAITLISTKGYNHFVVVKGVKDGDVLVGDPALGLKTIPRAEFESMWRGVMFVVRDEIATGRQNFNLDHEWAVRRKAPFGTALNRDGLATFTSTMPGFREF